MGNAQKRRFLGAGAVVVGIIVIAGGIASIWINDHEQYEWIYLLILAAAVVLALAAILPRQQILAVMQQPAVEAKYRRPDASDTTMRELNQRIAEVVTCAESAWQGNIPPLPSVPQDLIDACNAPAGSKPREVKLEILGYMVTRTVTPGDDPERVWRETHKTIIDTHLK